MLQTEDILKAVQAGMNKEEASFSKLWLIKQQKFRIHEIDAVYTSDNKKLPHIMI